MAKSKSDELDMTEEAVLPAPKETKKVIVHKVQRPVRRVSFEQWASLRNIKQSHKGGMRAFVPNPEIPRSIQDWDKLFESY